MGSEIIYHGLAGGKGFPAAFASTSLGREPGSSSSRYIKDSQELG